MKFRIISVKKRKWWKRLVSIDRWRVVLETEDKKIIKMNCWAGIGDEFNENYLINEIREKLRRLYHILDDKIKPLIDKVIEMDEINKPKKLKMKENINKN